MNRVIATLAVLVAAGCGDRARVAPDHADTTPDAVVVPDTAAAAALRDSATATLATLLDRPETAAFDSVIVVQPPREGARAPGMAVCGRIAGTPGIEGSAVPVRFVFQSKWALYVEAADNREQFAQVWANLCAVSGGMKVVGG